MPPRIEHSIEDERGTENGRSRAGIPVTPVADPCYRTRPNTEIARLTVSNEVTSDTHHPIVVQGQDDGDALRRDRCDDRWGQAEPRVVHVGDVDGDALGHAPDRLRTPRVPGSD